MGGLTYNIELPLSCVFAQVIKPLDVLKQTVLQVSSDLQQLNRVLAWFDECHHPAIAQKDWLQCQLALAEGFTNAVRHAHQGLSNDIVIDLEVRLYNNYLELRIWDHGPPFDLQSCLQALSRGEDMIDQQAGGGRGLAILDKIADHLSYDRTTDQRNCLLIVKQYS